MNRSPPTLIGVARSIHKALQQAAPAPKLLDLPESNWSELVRWNDLTQKAFQRGWRSAAQSCLQRFIPELHDLVRELERIQWNLPQEETPKPLPSIAEIHADLVAIQGEFEGFRIDPAKHLLAVHTESLVLDDVELGRFRIELRWDQLKDHTPYKTVPLEANSASTNPDVSHPHVQNDWLCEGNGQDAIHAALAEGRLLDFFLLVRQVLRTYNRASAFVPLQDWESAECYDCGELVGEIGECARCRSSVCGDCLTGCHDCEECYCSSCIGRCPACSASSCQQCLCDCCQCHESFCMECLDDGICSECERKLAEVAPAQASVQPNGVCQAPVPA